jgi:hypothetical protein
MVQSPYAPIVPWIVFALVQGHEGHGVAWAAGASVFCAVILLSMHDRPKTGVRNHLLVGAVVWFSLLFVVGLVQPDAHGFFGQYARGFSAIGYTMIALTSLVRVPLSEHYARRNTTPAQWNRPGFRQVNIVMTAVWAGAFALIAVSHWVAPLLDSSAGYTVFHWVVPIAIAALAMNRTTVMWDDYLDEELEQRLGAETMWDLSVGWEPESTDSSR